MTVRIANVDTVILQDPKISHFQFDGSSPERGRPGPRDNGLVGIGECDLATGPVQ